LPVAPATATLKPDMGEESFLPCSPLAIRSQQSDL
jgi:hypothetical protein